jgi:hypothetical protein
MSRRGVPRTLFVVGTRADTAVRPYSWWPNDRDNSHILNDIKDLSSLVL